MIYGFEENKFYVDIPSCSRPVGNMREESDLLARNLSSQFDNLLLTISSGLDSQSVLHSFFKQGIPIETVFFYMPGYNDIEYQHLQIVDKKYGIKTQVVDLNPAAIKDELHQEDLETGLHPLFLLQKRFVAMLPESANIIQNIHDPTIVVIDNQPHYMISLHSSEIEKDQAFKLLKRSGKHIFFGDTPEFRYSIYNDPVFRGVVTAINYYNSNNMFKNLYSVNDGDRWDFYIKPFIYGQYWRDELIYFPKFTGHEHMPFIRRPFKTQEHFIHIPYKELLNHLGQINGQSRRYYEQIPS